MTQAKKFEKIYQETSQSTKVRLLSLKSDEVADLYLRVAVMPPEEVERFPPRFDSLILDTMMGFKGPGARFLGGEIRKELELCQMQRALVGGPRYHASATAIIEEESLWLVIEGFQEYYWNISLQGVIYPPGETVGFNF